MIPGLFFCGLGGFDYNSDHISRGFMAEIVWLLDEKPDRINVKCLLCLMWKLLCAMFFGDSAGYNRIGGYALRLFSWFSSFSAASAFVASVM